MVSRRAKMLRRTLLPITREHRRHHQHADHRRHASYQPGERGETGKPAVVHPHFIDTLDPRYPIARRVFSASVLWKSSFGTTMATAGSGFSSSISRAPPKPDQLRNSPAPRHGTNSLPCRRPAPHLQLAHHRAPRHRHPAFFPDKR